MKEFLNNKKQRGSTLLFVVMIMSFMLTMGLAAAQVIFVEFQLAGDFGATTASFLGGQSATEEGLLNTTGSTAILGGTEYLSRVNFFPGRGYGFINRGKTSLVRRSVNKVIVEPMVATSGNSTFALTKYGYLFGAGLNDDEWGLPWDPHIYRLGLSTADNQIYFAPVINEVISTAVGVNHSMILKADGSVWVVGKNEGGQLGLGDFSQRDRWTRTALTDIINISAGFNSSYAIDRSGNLWVTGSNGDFQLGLGHNNSITSWKMIPSVVISNVKKVSAWSYHALAITTNGDLYVTGNNNVGQIGMGLGVTQVTQWQLSSAIINVKDIATSFFNSILATDSGSVWATGKNIWGALGTGDNTSSHDWILSSISNVEKVTAHFSGSSVLKSDHTVWSVGYNLYGVLGIGFCSSGGIFNWTQTSLSNIVYLSSQTEASYAIDNNNNLFVTGTDGYGQLGRGVGSGWICDWEQNTLLSL